MATTNTKATRTGDELDHMPPGTLTVVSGGQLDPSKQDNPPKSTLGGTQPGGRQA